MREGRGGAGPVARELPAVHRVPRTEDVERVPPEDELAQRAVHQVGDRTRRTAVVGLPEPDDPFVGDHLHEDGVPLDGRADPQADLLFRRDPEAERVCGHIETRISALSRVMRPPGPHPEPEGAMATACSARRRPAR
ncbi:hypothetical protein GCM10023215_29710 [Pseudonocardia yuanmonensis]|uniref:Uncharacterized protein n=1 Tax=Pseudonocardia yuanmonensis TaxID=1095914 RepID=A0ABP8WKC8_9PSEU